MRDTIACRDELPPDRAVPLLELVMTGGKRVRDTPTLAAMRSHLESQLRDLPDEARSLVSPVVPVAAMSNTLRNLDDEVRRRYSLVGPAKQEG
jgi:nicotinate phosphoribosyltransferase